MNDTTTAQKAPSIGFQRFRAMVHARNMEFIRDRGSFLWNILFPFFLIFGLAFAFPGESDTAYKVGYVGSDLPTAITDDLQFIEFIPYSEPGEALDKLRHHQIDFFIDPQNSSYSVAIDSTGGQVTESLLGPRLSDFRRAEVEGQPIRFSDWFIPGVIGMNMMFFSLFGVGYVIVRYRKNGVLKRLKATPVRPLEFVGAQATSRFIIVMLSSTAVFITGTLVLNFLMLGSYFDLIFLTGIANLCMISLGLIFAARMKNEELANGFLNLMVWPMMAFSGVFVSLEGSPQILQDISRIFPLTHYIEGARAIMLDGAGLVEILPNMIFLVVATAIFLSISALTFKWE